MRAHRAAALVAGEVVCAHARARAPPRVLGGWRHRLVAPAGCAHARVGTLAPLVCGVTVLAVPAVPAVPASPRWLHRGFAGSVVPPPSDPSPPPRGPTPRPVRTGVPRALVVRGRRDRAQQPVRRARPRGPALACAVRHDAHPAFVLAGVFAAAVSDWLDGHLARRWNQRSVAGTYLDPAGDKIFVASLAIALAVRGDVPAWLAACLVGRDAALVVASLYQRARALEWRWNTWAEFAGVADDNRARARLPPLEPQMLGKISTAGQFALFGGVLAHQAVGWPTAEMMETVHAAVGATTAASAAGTSSPHPTSSPEPRDERETTGTGTGTGTVSRGRARGDGECLAGTETKTGRDRSSGVASARGGARRWSDSHRRESGGCVVTRDAHAGSNPLGSEL